MNQEVLPMAQEGESHVNLFQRKEIRKVFNENEWWFSVKDVIEALVDTPNGTNYIIKIRNRDKGLKSRWGQIVLTLPFKSASGIQKTNFVNIEGIFRLMQSVPTKKAEPFKKWLARVGYERIQELQDPSIAMKRAIMLYRAKGYSDNWIESRLQNKASRDQLEDEWDKRGIEGRQYAFLTDAISVKTFGIKTRTHKDIKGLKSQSLRDNMTPIELTLTTLGEQATTEISRAKNAKGYFQNLGAAESGGSVAGKARKEIERQTGNRVVSDKNYLTENQRRQEEIELSNGLKKLVESFSKSPKVR